MVGRQSGIWVLLGCFAGCGSSAAPGQDAGGADATVAAPQIGILDYYGELIDAIRTPEAVPRGETFEVVVWTWGGGCLVPDSITVAETDEGITMTPYDRLDLTPGNGCTSDQREMPHEVELSPGDADELALTVVGRRHDRMEDVLVTVSVTIAVE
jgi:hypothetical protein